jgi:hypothetical protein
MIQLREQYWAVEVPKKYAQITIDPIGPILMWWSFDGVETEINLPPGTWEIVCASKEASVIQSMEIVEQEGNYFKDYDKDRFHHDIPFSSPIDSLNSLLTAKGCDLNKNYLILKKTA